MTKLNIPYSKRTDNFLITFVCLMGIESCVTDSTPETIKACHIFDFKFSPQFFDHKIKTISPWPWNKFVEIFFFNSTNLREIGGHGSPHIPYFINCELQCRFFEKTVDTFLIPFYIEFQLIIFFLIDRLPPKSKTLNVPQ